VPTPDPPTPPTPPNPPATPTDARARLTLRYRDDFLTTPEHDPLYTVVGRSFELELAGVNPLSYDATGRAYVSIRTRVGNPDTARWWYRYAWLDDLRTLTGEPVTERDVRRQVARERYPTCTAYDPPCSECLDGHA
jgi:hypothetical protein